MNKKIVLPLISLTFVSIGGTLLFQSIQSPFIFSATGHECSGNHYVELAETENSSGVKEYWACCGSHEKYYSTKDIPNYKKSNWRDAGVAAATTDAEDRYIPSPLASTMVKPGSEGFTTDGNTFVASTTTNGWIMSTETYYNYSVDVTVDHRASHNPWGDHYCTNSFILNGRSDNGRLYGYVLDFQSDFIQLSYLPNIAERDENHGGNVFFAQGGGHYSAHIDITGDVFTLSINNEVLQTVKLNRHWYQEGGTSLNIENVYYESGSIGFLAYADDDGIQHGRRLTISNFVKKDRHVLADTTFNSENDFSLQNNQRTVSTLTNSGWMMTNNSYNNFSLKVRVNNGANDNIFGDHITRNSILIGGGYSNGHLTGYVLEFQANHVEIAKLNGTEDYKTGDATVVIGYWGGDGAFGVGGKDIFVTVNNGTLTVSSMDGAWRPSGKDEYPTGNFTLNDYAGGSLGYLFNDNTAHTVDILQIA